MSRIADDVLPGDLVTMMPGDGEDHVMGFSRLLGVGLVLSVTGPEIRTDSWKFHRWIRVMWSGHPGLPTSDTSSSVLRVVE